MQSKIREYCGQDVLVVRHPDDSLRSTQWNVVIKSEIRSVTNSYLKRALSMSSISEGFLQIFDQFLISSINSPSEEGK